MKKSIIILTVLFISTATFAQHESHQMQQDTTDHEGIGHTMDGMMSHSFSRNLPMNRNGSGTGWLPDNSPMYGYMLHTDKWMYMFHGNIFLRYNNQDIGKKGSRGDSKFDAPNWFMGMGQRKIGNRGLLRFSAMLSLDPLTVGGEGYPLLFQSGETWQGEPLVDRQHPHDLFSELSVGYTHMFSENADAFVYLGYPGEPAFGPVAFMHRLSSLYNPDAPIGHHWQDATHITFGVATAGFRYRNFKIEASSFTGREPNEERYGFDKPRFDSWSARLSYNPSPAWALQVSQARVNDVHEFGPREDVNKTTASAIHSLRLNPKFFLNSAAVWGYNDAVGGHHRPSHSFLLESALTLNTTTVYGKYEWVEKSAEDLLLDEAVYGHGKLFPINSITLGIQQRLINLLKTNAAIGVQGSLYHTSNQLNGLYGKNPMALEVYLRIYPGLMGM
ncbi:MAG TPA: hypothetical protein VFM69_09175 [Pricia sp.]|nr:hypothetical protein [Pricia sp.]